MVSGTNISALRKEPSDRGAGPRFIVNSDSWEYPKIRGTLFGIRIIRILLFRVLY